MLIRQLPRHRRLTAREDIPRRRSRRHRQRVAHPRRGIAVLRGVVRELHGVVVPQTAHFRERRSRNVTLNRARRVLIRQLPRHRRLTVREDIPRRRSRGDHNRPVRPRPCLVGVELRVLRQVHRVVVRQPTHIRQRRHRNVTLNRARRVLIRQRPRHRRLTVREDKTRRRSRRHREGPINPVRLGVRVCRRVRGKGDVVVVRRSTDDGLTRAIRRSGRTGGVVVLGQPIVEGRRTSREHVVRGRRGDEVAVDDRVRHLGSVRRLHPLRVVRAAGVVGGRSGGRVDHAQLPRVRRDAVVVLARAVLEDHERVAVRPELRDNPQVTVRVDVPPERGGVGRLVPRSVVQPARVINRGLVRQRSDRRAVPRRRLVLAGVPVDHQGQALGVGEAAARFVAGLVRHAVDRLRLLTHSGLRRVLADPDLVVGRSLDGRQDLAGQLGQHVHRTGDRGRDRARRKRSVSAPQRQEGRERHRGGGGGHLRGPPAVHRAHSVTPMTEAGDRRCGPEPPGVGTVVVTAFPFSREPGSGPTRG